MKIKFDKELTVINAEVKTSGKGNKYATLTAFDREGNYHQIYVKETLLANVSNLQFKEDIVAVLEVTYKDKYDKVELLDIVL